MAAAKDARFLGDAEAIATWMAARPFEGMQQRELEYTVHRPSFHRHHWINVREVDTSGETAPHYHAVADRDRNEVTIYASGLVRFELFLNDTLVDLNKDVRIVVSEEEREYEFFNGRIRRDLGVLLSELVASNHPWRIYPVRFVIDMPELRDVEARRAAEEARRKAEGEDVGVDEDEEDDDEDMDDDG